MNQWWLQCTQNVKSQRTEISYVLSASTVRLLSHISFPLFDRPQAWWEWSVRFKACFVRVCVSVCPCPCLCVYVCVWVDGGWGLPVWWVKGINWAQTERWTQPCWADRPEHLCRASSDTQTEGKTHPFAHTQIHVQTFKNVLFMYLFI